MMLLQTKLYFNCKTLETMAAGANMQVLLYGIEQIRQQAGAWLSFFTPHMLESIWRAVEREEPESFESVRDMADCMKVLSDRCQEILTLNREGTRLSVRRRIGELRYDLREFILPAFEERDYDDPSYALLLVLLGSKQFISSFVPIEVTSSPVDICGVFAGAERVVLNAYFEAVKSAPSLAKFGEIQPGGGCSAVWVGYSSLNDVCGTDWIDAKDALVWQDHERVCADCYRRWSEEKTWV